ncbi:MAG: hypothetical protein C0408_05350, partial [Odoribacter sp.]|nr:hypothetical protein [Odoribacter sp.]
YVDSIVTNSRNYSYLGRIYDPYFGDTKTDFVGQLRLTKKWSGKELPIVDSVKLFLTIAGAKGTLDSTTLRQIRLFEITEQLNSAVKYFSNRDPNAGMEIGTFSLPVISKDTTKSMVIVLPVSFGEYLMRDTVKLTQDDNTNDFRTFFKGLYITMPDAPTPMLVAMGFSSSDFFIRVFYHNSTGNYNFDFIINTYSVRYNRYNHIFATADPAKKIKHINDGVKDTMIYLQAFNGVFPRIKIPGLSYIKNTLLPVSVNKARLTFTVFLDSINYFSTNVPGQILLKYTKADTIQYLVPDYLVNPGFFDGSFNSTKKTYSFNLASFVQEYLEGRIDEPVVEMYYPDGEYKNVILKANNGSPPVKFEFTYTRF